MTTAASPKRLAFAFLGSFAFLATIVGAYYGAAALNAAVGAFAFMIPAAILIALVRVYGKPAWETLREWRARIIKYELVMRSAAQATATVEDLEREVEVLQSQKVNDLQAGILEGRRRAIAEALGQSCGAVLAPIAVGVEEGKLVIAARIERGDRPPPGSRLLLRVRTMPRAKAALTVLEGGTVDNEVLLGVDEVLDEAFVLGMIKSAASGNSDPPGTLVITAREGESLYTFMTEDGIP